MFPRFPINMDVVALHNLTPEQVPKQKRFSVLIFHQAASHFIVCTPTRYGKLFPRLTNCPGGGRFDLDLVSIKKTRNVLGSTQLCPSAAPYPHRQPQNPSSPPPMATLSPSSLTSGRPFHLERQSKKTSGTSKWSSSQVQRLSLDHLTRFPSRPCSWVCWWGGWIQVKELQQGTKQLRVFSQQ